MIGKGVVSRTKGMLLPEFCTESAKEPVLVQNIFNILVIQKRYSLENFVFRFIVSGVLIFFIIFNILNYLLFLSVQENTCTLLNRKARRPGEFFMPRSWAGTRVV
jgi:hypothetical protein